MSINSLRLGVAIVLVVVAAKTGTPAMGQEGEQSSVASVRQADPAAQGGYFRSVGLDDRFQRVLSENTSASGGPSIPESQDPGFDGCLSPSWIDACPCAYVQVGALFLKREPRFSDRPIIVDPNTSTTFLSTSDLNSNFDAGLQVTVGRRLCGGRAVEFDYFGLFAANASAVVVSTDPNAFLTFPDNLAGNVFVDMDQAQVDYSFAVHSFAVNLLCCCGCCEESCCGEVSCRSVTWFSGFRYLNLAEELNISAQRTVAGAVEEGAYNIRTNNNLYGAQLGARLRRTRGRLGWDATGFAGIFGNDARQTQSVTDFPNFPLRPTVSSSQGGVAFVGGANLSGLYALNDVWNARAGYNVLWIEGVALAPDQLDFDFATSPSGNQISNGGGMFLHGVNVGLEARW
ncbi:MAG: BBP7 family outer membrane beta-barrel protein [Pirellulaceae bacterium]